MLMQGSRRIGLMIVASTLVMHLFTYTNVFDFVHIRISQERAYLALLMGSVMASVVMVLMWGRMYSNVPLNFAIIGGAVRLDSEISV